MFAWSSCSHWLHTSHSNCLKADITNWKVGIFLQTQTGPCFGNTYFLNSLHGSSPLDDPLLGCILLSDAFSVGGEKWCHLSRHLLTYWQRYHEFSAVYTSTCLQATKIEKKCFLNLRAQHNYIGNIIVRCENSNDNSFSMFMITFYWIQKYHLEICGNICIHSKQHTTCYCEGER